MDVVTWSTNFLRTFQEAQLPPPISSHTTYTSIWVPPPAGVVKIIVDAVFPPHWENFWMDLVARDSSGDCLWWFRRCIASRPTPVDGEALSAYHGFSLARDRGWRTVIIESDCLQLVNALSIGEPSLASFGAVAESCLKLCFQYLSFNFTRRTGNVLAHRIAFSSFFVVFGRLLPSFGFFQ